MLFLPKQRTDQLHSAELKTLQLSPWQSLSPAASTVPHSVRSSSAAAQVPMTEEAMTAVSFVGRQKISSTAHALSSLPQCAHGSLAAVQVPMTEEAMTAVSFVGRQKIVDKQLEALGLWSKMGLMSQFREVELLVRH